MLAVRGIYDGKTFHILPSERLPQVKGVVRVAILFLEDLIDEPARHRQIEAARRMHARRARMRPLTERIRDLIEEGRDR